MWPCNGGERQCGMSLCRTGLSVSLKQTSICVVDQAGMVVQRAWSTPIPEAISVLRNVKGTRMRYVLALKRGRTSVWTELKRLGLPVICIDARHAKAVLKMQIKQKRPATMPSGSRASIRTGWFKEVHVKDIDSHSVRALLASRALLVKIKRDLENHVRGLLKNLGLVIDSTRFNVFAVRAEELIEGRRVGGCHQTVAGGAQCRRAAG